MTGASDREATIRTLAEASVLWAVDGDFAPVVAAAVDGIVAGVESAALDQLAGSSPRDAYAERHALVVSTLDELGLGELPEDPTALAARAAAVTEERLARGELGPDDLAHWLAGSLTCEIRQRMETALDAGGLRPGQAPALE